MSEQQMSSESSESSEQQTSDEYRDAWTWRAVFANGDALDEYGVDSDGVDAPSGRGWRDVTRFARRHATTLVSIVLIPRAEPLRTHVITLSDTQTRARVVRRRRLIVDMATGASSEQFASITFVELKRGARARATYIFFFADGSVVISDDLNAV